MKDASDYELVIIGSGPAGYRAALQAAKMRKRVVVVEQQPEDLGGAWIHTGTIPSKTIRESLEAIHSIRFHAGEEWVKRVIHFLSADKLLQRSKTVAKAEENLMRRYFGRYEIEVVRGRGRLSSDKTVEVLQEGGTVRKLRGDNILVATGSRPRRPQEIPFDGWRIVDGDDILSLENIPASMLIYGAGVIGCEYACIFAAAGSKVTIIEPRNKIMQYMDQEVTTGLMKSMQDLGVEFLLGQTLETLTTAGPRVDAKLASGETLSSDVFFFAAGRQVNTENLGLEELGVELSPRGEIIVNSDFQTKVPYIYAAGDCIGSPALAATSANQGRYVACHIFGSCERSFPTLFPFGVYTIPELSCVGANEEQLKEQGVPYVVGRANYSEVARGYIRGDAHGLLKLLVCQSTHKILGIHIFGHDACNLIHIGLAFMTKGGHAQDLVDMIFNYPTLAEAYRIAAFNALNKLFPHGEIGAPPSEVAA